MFEAETESEEKHINKQKYKWMLICDYCFAHSPTEVKATYAIEIFEILCD